MAILHKSKRLKKELSLFNVYALATGATLSSGLFLLPGLAAAQAGPAVILAYLLAAVPLIPALFSMAELSTAMPRAGGLYYFLDRSMGPLVGTIGGLGTWLVLTLKTAFALVGMGAYLTLFLPQLPLTELAVALAVILGALNLLGAGKTGQLQGYLVAALLMALAWFFIKGVFHIETEYFQGFLDSGYQPILSTAGMVYVSYIGVTKIASLSEEVQNPERNLPRAMIWALVTALVIYGVGTTVMVGCLPAEVLHQDLTPVATTARRIAGPWGAIAMTAAAVLAFFSVTNAAILSASRYPLAMSRDHLLPRFFRLLSKKRTPKTAIGVTVALIVAFLTLLDPTKIAKLASAFQLLLFALACLAVIIMRESRIESYDPGYRSPLYPWMPILGILAPMVLIVEMGWWSTLFSLGLIVLGGLWYLLYARRRVERSGAVLHVFARLGERRYAGLDRELRGILREKGLRDEDPFDFVIARAQFVDLKHAVDFEDVVRVAAEKLGERLKVEPRRLQEGFMQGTRLGATPVSKGVALPHIRLPRLPWPQLVMVRCHQGVRVEVDEELLGERSGEKPVHAFFFLVSPQEDPGQHLRLLAQIAEHAGSKGFVKRWLAAQDEHELKTMLHRDEHFLSLLIRTGTKAAELIGRPLAELKLPAGTLVALIHRDGQLVIPRPRTVLKDGDRLTIIGEPLGIQKLAQRYLKADGAD